MLSGFLGASLQRSGLPWCSRSDLFTGRPNFAIVVTSHCRHVRHYSTTIKAYAAESGPTLGPVKRQSPNAAMAAAIAGNRLFHSSGNAPKVSKQRQIVALATGGLTSPVQIPRWKVLLQGSKSQAGVHQSWPRSELAPSWSFCVSSRLAR